MDPSLITVLATTHLSLLTMKTNFLATIRHSKHFTGSSFLDTGENRKRKSKKRLNFTKAVSHYCKIALLSLTLLMTGWSVDHLVTNSEHLTESPVLRKPSCIPSKAYITNGQRRGHLSSLPKIRLCYAWAQVVELSRIWLYLANLRKRLLLWL